MTSKEAVLGYFLVLILQIPDFAGVVGDLIFYDLGFLYYYACFFVDMGAIAS
ncbi:MAG: hypothetical protein KME28_15175 [Pelatocladus maniniholoensis HA4357-MV3]|uniref:Uncharacterized protein n=1 Tax=Pelatocladus maniniholoensis HA4357-MV3 TaxID=1117104 RepID=A0A9E3H9D0_9NOST|nr:hypothetical protein [Pelatocladus maniniholoensis HA4357-MV3]